MVDWSYYHNVPRSVVHGGTPPPRQYLRGGGRSYASAGEGSSVLLILGALALIFLASRRK